MTYLEGWETCSLSVSLRVSSFEGYKLSRLANEFTICQGSMGDVKVYTTHGLLYSSFSSPPIF